METKHTPGPWKAVSHSACAELDCMQIAEVAYMRVIPESGGWPPRIGVPEDDARLIAAAPELLEACIAMSAHYSASLDHQPAYVRIARSAIAKAEGR